MKRVGTVTAAWRYPVKSMRGEALQDAPVTLQGIAGDRNYAFVQADDRSVFPWLTGRQVPTLLGYRPTVDAAPPHNVVITTPAGRALAIDSAELREELEQRFGAPVFLLRDYRGSFDVAAITLVSNATVRAIAERSGTPLDPERLRMTFYVDAEGGPFAEDALVGKVVRIGATCRVAFTERDKRCMMTTLDPAGSGPAAPAVLRAIAELNEATAGVYGSVLAPGHVSVGDEVSVED